MTPRGPLRCGALAVAGLLSALLSTTGCGQGEAAAWAQRVRAGSEQADRAVAAGSPLEAEAALAALAEGSAPAAVAPADLLAVRQDAWARRALLRLTSGRAAEAEGAASAGLALGDPAASGGAGPGSAFEVTLLILRGRAREAQGRDAQAATDYQRAAALDEALLGALLHEPRSNPGDER